MDKDNAIEVRNISKSFKVYYDKGNELKEKMLFWKRNKYEKRVVLDDISFSVKKGEAVGLVGKNGCGKSTTLKLLTKIIYPDKGTIEMSGRVSSLLELGAGFHPDMSGRENIYTNASIFGLTKKEIDARLNDIIEFSELGTFIDNPVRTYSSGMYMRLAFSVAINVDADILLIDEILAVGDANFQAKCFNKLREIKAQGTTIVIVSHALEQIEEICERSIWVRDGHIQQIGEPKEIHKAYLTAMEEERREQAANERKQLLEAEEEQAKRLAWEKRHGSWEVKIGDVKLVDKNGVESSKIYTGESMTLEIPYVVNTPINDIEVKLDFYRIDSLLVYRTSSVLSGVGRLNFDKDNKLSITFDNVPFVTSEYYVNIALETKDGDEVDVYKEAVKFIVESAKGEGGVASMNNSWK
ncbi:ABC transporter ATP-binding protein [Lachnospira multipara]|uniref:ABC transporter ATP-binding protein n=1 Tax=Lachnospira multipara TaxID=28051 RepID=UPI0004E1571D|nr:ABC transporter ATP-binding protein [Lachnospira multipara]